MIDGINIDAHSSRTIILDETVETISQTCTLRLYLGTRPSLSPFSMLFSDHSVQCEVTNTQHCQGRAGEKHFFKEICGKKQKNREKKQKNVMP